MSTPATSPIYTGPRPTTARMTDEQLELLKQKVIGLRRLSVVSGFSTAKMIVDLLSRVAPSDLIVLGLMFEPSEDRGNR